ncbi:putative retrotransposon hot spot protein (RHS) [Trypanosoma cruzi]|uniref:Putative retrotransposon hot spot protein (RHS) n=1 Tax=Trypanosoma cruzi TaxID=5693 RepID=A0A2V2X8R9_TRYCR|nr:putative retrotransposon hot spot protein (RHS) [Trypanosoma cruzi]
MCNFGWHFNAPISAHPGNKTLCMLAMLMQPNDFHLLILRLQHNLVSKKKMEKCTVIAFLGEDFITAVRHKLRDLKRTTRRQPHRSALEVYSQERPTRHCVLLSLEYFSEKVGVNCWALHMPEVEDFPLWDALFFVESNPMPLVVCRRVLRVGSTPQPAL